MAKIRELTEAEFDLEVLKADEPVLVDFGAEWCGPCKKLAPIVEELATEMNGTLKVFAVDVGVQPGIATRYGVLSVPTVLLFRGGELRERIVGLTSKDKLVKTIQRLS